jgi:hypothetical protein
MLGHKEGGRNKGKKKRQTKEINEEKLTKSTIG